MKDVLHLPDTSIPKTSGACKLSAELSFEQNVHQPMWKAANVNQI